MVYLSWHIVMRMKAPKEGTCDQIALLELPHSLHAFQRVSSSDSLNVEGYHTFRGGFWNYFSMGVDYILGNPRSMTAGSGTVDTMYAKLGCTQGWFFASLVHPSSSNTSDGLRIYMDKKGLTDCSYMSFLYSIYISIEEKLCQLYAQLAKVKIMKSPGHWEDLNVPHRDLTRPYVDDGLLEVVGFRDAWHGLVLLAPNGHGTRLAQAHRIRFELHKGAADHTFMRIDGEPWKQPLPADDDTVVVEISHLVQVNMLATRDCISKSISDPSTPMSHHGDEDVSENSDDEWEGGRKKFGAAETFKISEDTDISHLS
ncbi:hypothetical protein ZIOFF_021674 [Zingiber officinale]|uniref:Diacylglycerol kinase accessory domain-containing protein n=1 Tax=Zingiber officinale TaxID=94328 RepID=A0A8J5LH41_ZINOF|nr:hypothetical protein ZIOFF_021674 [Zingiber officinale]